MKNLILITAVVFGCAFAKAQITTPQPSPAAEINQVVGLTDVKVTYSRPSKKGRQIFGGLEAWGKVWRTGANANTVVTFGDDVEVFNKTLKAGSYALYLRPNEEAMWDVYFYSKTDNWGTPEKWDDSLVAVSGKVNALVLPYTMEAMSIMVNGLSDNGAELDVVWDRTLVSIPFSVPTDMKAEASIAATMKGSPSSRDYNNAATYYHEGGKDLKQALAWSKEATKGDTDSFWMWRRRSLIEADLGMKADAIKSAKISLAGAKKANYDNYIKMNEASLKEWGAM